jgi:hypothetical protein
VGKNARLAHARDFGQGANRQTFQANLGGQAQSRIDNGCFGLLAFVQAALPGGMAFGFCQGVANGAHRFSKKERPCYFARF